MGHHSHSHSPPNYTFAFALGIGLNVVYIGVEITYGLAVDSLALLADAGHNVSDVLGLLLAWAGYRLSQIPPSTRHTYGWRSGSILAAFLNAILLLIAVGAISWEAIQRFSHPVQVSGNTIMAVAGVGVVINLFHRPFIFARAEERHQYSRCLSPYGRRCRGLSRGRVCRIDDKILSTPLDRSECVSSGGRRYSVKHLEPFSRLDSTSTPRGSPKHRSPESHHVAPKASKRNLHSRPAYLGHEYHRNSTDCPSGSSSR